MKGSRYYLLKSEPFAHIVCPTAASRIIAKTVPNGCGRHIRHTDGTGTRRRRGGYPGRRSYFIHCVSESLSQWCVLACLLWRLASRFVDDFFLEWESEFGYATIETLVRGSLIKAAKKLN